MSINEVLRRELIGCNIKIGSNTGKIIDETKNIVVVEMEDGKKKKFLKKNNFFEVIIGNKIVKIDGNRLLLRPEERIKIR